MAENIKDPSTPRSGRRRKRPRSGETRLTQAMENYLLSIYLVQEQGLTGDKRQFGNPTQARPGNRIPGDIPAIGIRECSGAWNERV